MPTELLTDPGHTRQDLSLIRQAMNRAIKYPEIPIPPAIIEAMPKIAGTILLKGKQREQLQAGKLLLAFMEYNKSVRQEAVPQQIEHHHTHELGPVTEQNFAEVKRQLVARISGAG